jgi:putative membrane protein
MDKGWKGATIVAALLVGAPAYGQEPGSQMGTGGQRSPGDQSAHSTTSNQGSGMSGTERGTSGSQGSSSTQGTGSAGSATATAGSASAKALKGDLEEKLQELHAANKAEVQLGQIGSQKAQSPDVKQYAEKLSQDHQKNDDKLQQIAQTAGVNLEGKEFQKKQEVASKDLAKLQAKQGQEFDKAFIKHMVKDHEKDVKEVEKAAKEARKQNQTELASFFETTHTGLQGHLQEAQRIEKSLGHAQAQSGSRAGQMGTGSGAAGATGAASGGTSPTTGAPSGSSPQTGSSGSGSHPAEPASPGAGGTGAGTSGSGGTSGRPAGGGGGGPL